MSPHSRATAVRLLDILTVATTVLMVSAVIVGPVEFRLVHVWRVTWASALVVLVALWAIRHAIERRPTVVERLTSWTTRMWRHRDLRDAARAALMTRAAILLCGAIAIATIHRAPDSIEFPANEFTSLPAKWDARWYVGIASGGYRWDPSHDNPRIAFFPAFPLALRATAAVIHLPPTPAPWLWSGVLLSNVFFVGALAYCLSLASALGVSDENGRRAIWFLACYPFSLFYGQDYSESLFLLCALASCYYLEVGRWRSSAVAGLVLGLVRPTGILIAAPLAWRAIMRRNDDHPQACHRAPFAGAVVAALTPALGLLAYALYMKHVTGDLLAWMHVQELWGRHPGSPLTPYLDLVASVRADGLARVAVARPYDLLNGAAALFALALSPGVWRRYGAGYCAFVLLSVLIPLAGGGFQSLGRFTCVLFPVFLYLGESRLGRRESLVCFSAIQAVLAALFFTDRSLF